MIHFTLYSRNYCHLCDEMRIALEKLMRGTSYQLTVIDIDQDAVLVELYDELVPVLFANKTASEEKTKLCHYFLDFDKVKEFCHA
jgi:hypothetical protein